MDRLNPFLALITIAGVAIGSVAVLPLAVELPGRWYYVFAYGGLTGIVLAIARLVWNFINPAANFALRRLTKAGRTP